MLSTFPAMSTSDSFFQFPFPPLETGFTPWDCPEPPFVIPYHHQPSSPENPQEWVMPDSPSDNSNPKPIVSNSGVNREASAVDERKRRRMISNRESARRSRSRKQRQLQNLREEMNRLIIGNRELMNRLSFIAHHCQLVRSENDRLVSEFLTLRRKLLNMRQVLLHRRLQHLSSPACPFNTTTVMPINQQTHIYN